MPFPSLLVQEQEESGARASEADQAGVQVRLRGLKRGLDESRRHCRESPGGVKHRSEGDCMEKKLIRKLVVVEAGIFMNTERKAGDAEKSRAKLAMDSLMN